MSTKQRKRRNRQPKNMKDESEGDYTPSLQQSKLLDYAELIANPCTGPLVAPEYGASDHGYLARFQKSHNLTLAAGQPNGFFVYFPDYTGDVGDPAAAATTNGSIVGYADSSSTARPSNTIASPQFQALLSTDAAGFSSADPAHNWVAGESVQDARTVAACLQMAYLGTVSGCQGRVGFLEGIPREMLLTGGAGGLPPNVNELMSIAADIDRLPLNKLEIKYRPSTSGEAFRSEGGPGVSVSPDNCFTVGIPGTSITTLGQSGISTGSGTGIGFVWQGLPTDGSTVNFTVYKSVEWRPEASAGIVMPVPRAISGNNHSQQVVAMLDRSHPGWTRVAQAGTDMLANKLSNIVLGGAPFPVPPSFARGVKKVTRAGGRELLHLFGI